MVWDVETSAPHLQELSQDVVVGAAIQRMSAEVQVYQQPRSHFEIYSNLIPRRLWIRDWIYSGTGQGTTRFRYIEDLLYIFYYFGGKENRSLYREYHTACLKTSLLSHLPCLNKVDWLIYWIKNEKPKDYCKAMIQNNVYCFFITIFRLAIQALFDQVYRCYWTYVGITILYRWRMTQ